MRLRLRFQLATNRTERPFQALASIERINCFKGINFSHFTQLTVNALVQLVTIVETMLGDVLHAVVLRYPQKLGGKRSILIQTVHRYMEVKATRDIFVHNRGIANEVYVRKAGTHARTKPGMVLPTDIQYFLESYEHCLQFIEWLELELHHRWHSSDYETRTNNLLPLEATAPAPSEQAGDSSNQSGTPATNS